jgi:hypothetical protein
MKYEDIKDFYERCETHPDHQTGMISYRMIERRLQEEIEELREYIEQRQWVGLTDEEVKHMLELFVIPPQHIEMVVQAIEAKLKEKNT